MSISWEALTTFAISVVGLIIWLAKIGVKLDLLIESVKQITINQDKFAKKEDMYKELGRLEKTVDAAHSRIDMITNSNGNHGYNGIDK